MPDTASPASQLGDLIIGQTTVVTVCVALMIWLGLLGRPSRATLYWTLGFILALLGSYGSLTTAAMGADVLLHPVAIGITCGMPALVWSGLRSVQGKRAYPWIGFVQSLVTVAILFSTTGLATGFTVFRWMVLATALAAGLGAVEVLRGSFKGSRYGGPLIASSGILVLVGIGGVISANLFPDDQSDIRFVRIVVLATTIYFVCATVSLLFLANRRPGANDVLDAVDNYMPQSIMHAIVREKLVRAAVRNEQNWSFIDIRLDDVIDLREATGETSFGAMVRRMEKTVIEVFPAEADLCRVESGHLTIFVGQSSAAVRELVRSVLNSIATPSADAPTTLRITASAGIVMVDAQVDTYDRLVAVSGAAAAESQLQGGDRWKRVSTRAEAR
jgi:GGDEF domain-containing protein